MKQTASYGCEYDAPSSDVCCNHTYCWQTWRTRRSAHPRCRQRGFVYTFVIPATVSLVRVTATMEAISARCPGTQISCTQTCSFLISSDASASAPLSDRVNGSYKEDQHSIDRAPPALTHRCGREVAAQLGDVLGIALTSRSQVVEHIMKWRQVPSLEGIRVAICQLRRVVLCVLLKRDTRFARP